MMKRTTILLLCTSLITMVGCSSQQDHTGFYSPTSYQKKQTTTRQRPQIASYQQQVRIKSSVPSSYPKPPIDQMVGKASWYGPGFHGKATANGEQYNQKGMTAAHRLLPMNTMLKVTNMENGRSVVVRINDRGPYKKNRILDLTQTAAERLGYFNQGTAKVSLEVLEYPKSFDPKWGFDPYRQVVIQLAVFKDNSRAQSFKKQLAGKFEELDFKVDRPKPGAFHVIAGPFEDKARAGKVSAVLKKLGVESFVRSYRK